MSGRGLARPVTLRVISVLHKSCSCVWSAAGAMLGGALHYPTATQPTPLCAPVSIKYPSSHLSSSKCSLDLIHTVCSFTKNGCVHECVWVCQRTGRCVYLRFVSRAGTCKIGWHRPAVEMPERALCLHVWALGLIPSSMEIKTHALELGLGLIQVKQGLCVLCSDVLCTPVVCAVYTVEAEILSR